MRKPNAPAAPVAMPSTHRADAVQAFLSTWLPSRGVAAQAFTQADAEALLAAVDAAGKSART